MPQNLDMTSGGHVSALRRRTHWEGEGAILLYLQVNDAWSLHSFVFSQKQCHNYVFTLQRIKSGCYVNYKVYIHVRMIHHYASYLVVWLWMCIIMKVHLYYAEGDWNSTIVAICYQTLSWTRWNAFSDGKLRLLGSYDEGFLKSLLNRNGTKKQATAEDT